MVLAEKGIAVDVVDVDAKNLPDEVMDFNPYGSVPTLVDRDLRLYESRIIMEYLDERFPHPPLLPVDPVSRASARLFMYRIDRDWYAAMDLIFKGSEDEAEQARKELRESLIGRGKHREWSLGLQGLHEPGSLGRGKQGIKAPGGRCHSDNIRSRGLGNMVMRLSRTTLAAVGKCRNRGH